MEVKNQGGIQMLDGEIVYGVLGGSLKLGLFKSTSAAVVVTNRRLVYAMLTNQMMKDAVNKAGEKAKAEGKGLLGRIGATMSATGDMLRKLASMDPDEVIAMNPDNFSVPVDAVVKARFDRITKTDHEGDSHGESLDLHIATGDRKLKLNVTFMTASPEEMLRNSLGSKLGRGKFY